MRPRRIVEADRAGREKWDGMSHVERCAWSWAATVHAFHDHVDQVVALEDLTGDNGWMNWTLLLEVCGLPLGIPLDDSRVRYESLRDRRENVTAKKLIGPFDTWPKSEQDDFWRWARPIMERLGYV